MGREPTSNGKKNGNGKHAGGRPPVELTPRQIKTACEHRTKGYAIPAIAEVMGLAPSTLYHKLHSLPEFQEAYARATKSLLSEDRETLHALANGKCKEIKQITNEDGTVKTIITQPIPDQRALALELAIIDPDGSNPSTKVKFDDFWVAPEASNAG